MKALLHTGGLLLLALASFACVEPEDKPSNVHDLRVLGVSTEKPELIASTCEQTPEAFDELAAEVTYRALLVDPAGEGAPSSTRCGPARIRRTARARRKRTARCSRRAPRPRVS
ncbi:hypothetical protein [Corallococcus sp. 4LFB]|uniref:hypothetical protein n=1 Tax=Corallococcus sp. 4LFB TaxID=3383249 RepID=UPI003976B7B9